MKPKTTPKPLEYTTLPKTLIQRYEEAKQTVCDAVKLLKTLEKKIVERLDGKEVGEFGDPDRVVRYFMIHRKEYVVPATEYHRLKIVKREEPKK